MIKISVSAADAVLTQTETLTAGMVSLPTVQFTFSSDWDDLGKTAVIRAGTVVEELLVTNNQITVPATCMASAGVNLIIGVWGGNQTVELPTVWCACGEILEGTEPSEAENHEEATASNVAQMLAYADAIEQYASELSTNVIRDVNVNDTNANRYGTVQVTVADSGAGDNRTLTFTFANMKGNGIESITFTGSGDYKGRIQVRLSDGTVTNFDALITAFQDMADISAAEALRVIAEGLRVNAEDARVLAEEGRVSAEEGRVDAEKDRVAAEEARAAEWEEWSSETEQERRANELVRIANEEERQENERTRQGNENDRISNERARQEAEDLRASAESSRVDAEAQRQQVYLSKEDVANKVTSWTSTTTDTHYPSEKLVKDTINALPATSTPQMDGTGAVGSSSKLAKEDHVHPSDTSRVPTTRKVNNKALSADVVLDAEDIQYDGTLATHETGSVGEALDAQSRRIDELTEDTQTVTGNPIEINDVPADNMPSKHTILTLNPIQAGSGDPSPTNVRAISGRTNVNVIDRGSQDFYTNTGLTAASGYIENINSNSFRIYNTSSSTYVSSKQLLSNYNLVNGKKYTVTAKVENTANENGIGYVTIRNSSNGIVAYSPRTTVVGKTLKCTFIYDSSTMNYLSFFANWDTSSVVSTTYSDIRFFEGDANVTFVEFPSSAETVYGGTVDVEKGELTNLWGVRNFDDLTWNLYEPGGDKKIFYAAVLPLSSVSGATECIFESYIGVTHNLSVMSDLRGNFGQNITGNAHCVAIRDDSVSTAADFKTKNTGRKFIFKFQPFASPTTYQLTPTELSLFLGYNYIYSNDGNCNISLEYGAYLTSLADLIERLTARVAALENA